jgi:dolichyl-phosphate-mannose--protein O-mannosyl transferase
MDLISRILASKLFNRSIGNDLFNVVARDYLEENVPYVIMRVFCGISGLLVVPIAYLTIRGVGHSIPAGLVAALMVCYGNFLVSCFLKVQLIHFFFFIQIMV